MPVLVTDINRQRQWKSIPIYDRFCGDGIPHELCGDLKRTMKSIHKITIVSAVVILAFAYRGGGPPAGGRPPAIYWVGVGPAAPGAPLPTKRRFQPPNRPARRPLC